MSNEYRYLEFLTGDVRRRRLATADRFLKQIRTISRNDDFVKYVNKGSSRRGRSRDLEHHDHQRAREDQDRSRPCPVVPHHGSRRGEGRRRGCAPSDLAGEPRSRRRHLDALGRRREFRDRALGALPVAASLGRAGLCLPRFPHTGFSQGNT